jgi:hypothetical protein
MFGGSEEKKLMAQTKGELLVKKWIKALRSGKYKQTRGTLLRVRKYNKVEEKRYCCLGVLCDLAVKEGLIGKPKPSKEYGALEGSYAFGEYTSQLPRRVYKLVGLDGGFGDYADHCQSLAAHNDHDKMNFKRIADIIESRPKGLFREKAKAKKK